APLSARQLPRARRPVGCRPGRFGNPRRRCRRKPACPRHARPRAGPPGLPGQPHPAPATALPGGAGRSHSLQPRGPRRPTTAPPPPPPAPPRRAQERAGRRPARQRPAPPAVPDPTTNPILVVGAGPGQAPAVSVYDTATGALRAQFLAYEPSFTGGVRVSTID